MGNPNIIFLITDKDGRTLIPFRIFSTELLITYFLVSFIETDLFSSQNFSIAISTILLRTTSDLIIILQKKSEVYF